MMGGHADHEYADEETPYKARKFWQVPEAEAELPLVRRVLEEIRYLMRQSMEMHVHVGLEQKIAQRIEGLKNRGIEIKDLSTGLVDFYALRNNEVIYLCWREGERKIKWWHEISTGFQNRQPLTPTERTGGMGKTAWSAPKVQVPGYQ